MRDIDKAFRRPPAVRLPDRHGGFPRLSDGVAHGSRCPASLRHALLAESLGKPSLWVIINEIWYKLMRSSHEKWTSPVDPLNAHELKEKEKPRCVS